MGTRELYADTCLPHRLGPGRDQPAENTRSRGRQRRHGENALSPETQPHSCAASLQTPKSSLCRSRLKCSREKSDQPPNQKPKPETPHRTPPGGASPFQAKLEKLLSELTQREGHAELKTILLHTLALPKLVSHRQCVSIAMFKI